MNIVEEKLYLISGVEDIEYYHEGIEIYAKDAVEINMDGGSSPPLFDNILIDYQDFIEQHVYEYVMHNYASSLENESEEYIQGFVEEVEDILLEESPLFIEEFCESNLLTTLKKVYDEYSYDVLYITERNSPQVKLITKEVY